MIATLLQILVGVALLLLGRRLYWLFIGGVGFLFGLVIASLLFGGLEESVLLIISLVIGLLFGLAAVFIQKPMAMIAGFLRPGLPHCNCLHRPILA
ncbi:MAG: hypothetical protein HC837_06070 [Chloroflexaceae bacterium]|nr:hypothetical protein [Chloroflexaceae bacterium]